MYFWLLSFESPRWGSSNEFTQYTISRSNKKISINVCFLELSEENKKVELTVVNTQSVFELLRVYCSLKALSLIKTYFILTLLWIHATNKTFYRIHTIERKQSACLVPLPDMNILYTVWLRKSVLWLLKYTSNKNKNIAYHYISYK